MNCRRMAILAWMLACGAIFASPAAFKVEPIGACTCPDVSEVMKGVLQDQGLRVSGDKGPVCDIWLRKILPLKPGATTPEYPSLSSGEFVGVMVYAAQAGDYRGQELKPGVYTMRYQTMPSDGNHMGVSPSQEYVLLSVAAQDKDPGKDIEYEALLDLSRKVSGTNHPTPLYLTSPAGGSPSFRDSGAGHGTVELKTKAQPSTGASIEFPLSLVLIGKGEG